MPGRSVDSISGLLTEEFHRETVPKKRTAKGRRPQNKLEQNLKSQQGQNKDMEWKIAHEQTQNQAE